MLITRITIDNIIKMYNFHSYEIKREKSSGPQILSLDVFLSTEYCIIITITLYLKYDNPFWENTADTTFWMDP